MQITLCSLAKCSPKDAITPAASRKRPIMPFSRRPSITTAMLAAVLLLTAVGAGRAGTVIYVDKRAPGGGDGTSWDAAYTSIYSALADALPGDEVRIAQGIYTPGPDWSRYALKNGVAYMGGYAGLGEQDPNERDFEKYPTILSGDRYGNDRDIEDFTKLADDRNRDENYGNILYAEDLDDQTILDGFTISGGTDTSGSALTIYESSIQVANCIITRNSGYAVEIARQSHPTFTNCTFLENAAHSSRSRGGGMEIDDDCQVILTNCTFKRNYHCGISNNGKAQITDCAFIDNISTGISNGGQDADGTTITDCLFTGNRGNALFNNRCSPTIRRCTFVANSGPSSAGGAIYNDDADPNIIDCLFKANYANRGGAICNDSGFPTLINCVFLGNLARIGGGAILNRYSCRPLILNCTFTGNSAKYGGAICNRNHVEAEIANCILWGNLAQYGPEVALQDPYYTPYSLSRISISSSNIRGGLGALYIPAAYRRFGLPLDWGNGNIDADPLFAQAEGADLIFGTEDDNPRLLPGSPCVNAGDNAALPASISLDLDGEPRISEGIVDMGAYEGPDQAFILSVPRLAVPEGSTAQFTVALAMDPIGPVEVNVVSDLSDPDITVHSGAILTFDTADYNVPQIVTLAAQEDSDRFTGTAKIRIAAPGFRAAGLLASEEENEPYPDTLLVDKRATGTGDGSSWENAYTDLNAAITEANSVPEIKQIRVAQGTYTPAPPSGDRAASFRIVNGLTVMGGYAGLGASDGDERDTAVYSTVLSGDLNGNDFRPFD
ncbi:MAG: right-handed parallel beta-helix repeat-containing protein, partial [Planctomycetota bacterium]